MIREQGYRHPLLIMQASGGVATAAEAARTPVFTIGSGPVAGLVGCAAVGRRAGDERIIATDMGGTSFDVGIVDAGEPLTDSHSVVNQYNFYMPRLRVESIGAGGGSLLWIDENSRTLRVGPESAGAVPGPACYSRGGTRPTTTDANVVLGFYADDAPLSDGLVLDRDAARRALATVAEPLGMSVVEAAAGATRIIDHQMAGLMRQLTLEQGLDPRDFSVYAFGGAAGLHASGYTRALGAARFVVPRGNLASGFSALGVVDSDVLHIYEHAELLRAPFDPTRMNQIFEGLEELGRKQLAAESIGPDATVLERSAGMKFSLQIHEVETPVPGGTLDAAAAERQAAAFVERYEEIYGKGSAFPDAGCEIGVLRVRARGRSSVPEPSDVARGSGARALGSREIYWSELREARASAVFDGISLGAGDTVAGPAVVEFPSTLVALRPGDRGAVDAHGNFRVDVALEDAR